MFQYLFKMLSDPTNILQSFVYGFDFEEIYLAPYITWILKVRCNKWFLEES